MFILLFFLCLGEGARINIYPPSLSISIIPGQFVYHIDVGTGVENVAIAGIEPSTATAAPAKLVSVPNFGVEIVQVTSPEFGLNATFHLIFRKKSSNLLSTGANHSCKLAENKVFCWGDGRFGALGTGATQSVGDSVFPVSASVPVAFSLALAISTVVDVTVGKSFSCARFVDARVFCWGRNSHGQLGTGNTEDVGDTPGELAQLGSIAFNDAFATDKVVQVVCGTTNVCTRHMSGGVLCWGDGSTGVNGRNSAAPVFGPLTLTTFISFSDSLPAAYVSVSSHACAIHVNQRVRCWGLNEAQELGDGSASSKGSGAIMPHRIADAEYVSFSDNTEPAVHTSLGTGVTCVLFKNGRAICFGAPSQYGLSDSVLGTQNMGCVGSAPCPVSVANASYIEYPGSALAQKVSVGSTNHACVLYVDGGILCYGVNTHGNLGTSDLRNIHTHDTLSLSHFPSIRFSSSIFSQEENPLAGDVSVGNFFTCAVFKQVSHGVVCFGRGENGENGRNTGKDAGTQDDAMENITPITFPVGMIALSRCGNGVLDEGEACDDGNVLSGDGCGGHCETEVQFVCSNEFTPVGMCKRLPKRKENGECELAEHAVIAEGLCCIQGFAPNSLSCV